MNTDNGQFLIPLQLFATQYGYSALLDDNDNEEPITEAMIKAACEQAIDGLYWVLPDQLLMNNLPAA